MGTHTQYTHTVYFPPDFWLYEWEKFRKTVSVKKKTRQCRWVGDLGSSMLCVMCEETVPRGCCSLWDNSMNELRRPKHQQHTLSCPQGQLLHYRYTSSLPNDLSSAEDCSHRDFNPGQSYYSLTLFLPPRDMDLWGALTLTKYYLCSFFSYFAFICIYIPNCAAKQVKSHCSHLG